MGGGRSSHTIDLRHRWVVRLARGLDIPPDQVTKRDVMQFARGFDWSAETRRSAYSSWRRFFDFCHKEGYIDQPLDLPTVKRSKPAPRPADDDALAKVLASTDGRVVLAARLAYLAGLRRGEVVKVHPGRDLIQDLGGWSLMVHGKGNKRRIVPLPDSLADDLRRHKGGYLFPGNDDGHLSASYLGKLVARALPDGVTMHALRHRYATRVYHATSDLVSVQELLGHASPETTIRYVYVPDSRLRKAAMTAA